MTDTIAFDNELEVQKSSLKQDDYFLTAITPGEQFHLNGVKDIRRIASLLNEAADKIEDNE